MIQPRFLDVAPASFDTISEEMANELTVRWGHNLGALDRPFSTRAYAFLVDEEPLSVAMSASAVSSTVAGYRRFQVVELARLCTKPGQSWATRVMLRVWREVFAQRWPDWPVEAAIAYSQNAWHEGSIYRADGWERVKDDCGSSGGGTYSNKRVNGDAHHGKKTLWVWRYAK